MGIPGLPSGLGSWLAGGAIKAMLTAIASAVDGAAADALRLTTAMIGSTTDPGLLSAWFSATYWRVAALSALLTVPFLFAAAVHALLRCDITLIGRSAFGYLPLAALGVMIAAPLTTLLLAATDEMCTAVAGAAGHADTAALARAARDVVGLALVSGSPMLGFFIGLLVVLATLGLWIELLIRAAAVDVIVLMLPLFFAAMVWPARRVWAIRATETLVALILSKFAIIAVLTLGGAAVGSSAARLSSSLVGATLIVLAALSPWALLRLLPLHEVAAAAAGGLSHAPRAVLHGAGGAVYDGVRAATAQPETGTSPGLDGEDDAAASVARTAGLEAGAVGGGIAGRRRRAAGGDPPEPLGRAPGFDAGTVAGLRAIERAGGRAAHVAGFAGGETDGASFPAGPVTAAVARRPDDDRPPINAAFAPGRWEGFILGEEGDEVMQAPRFGPDQPPPGPPAPGPESPVPEPESPAPEPAAPAPVKPAPSAPGTPEPS